MDKYIVGIAALMIMVGLSTQASAALVTKTDIIFLVDESGSMGGAHEWLHDMIGLLEAKLIAAPPAGAGITDNLYGLVGFGSYAHTPEASWAGAHSHTFGGDNWTCWNNGDSIWGTAAEFAIGTTPPPYIPPAPPAPLPWLESTGNEEDGWHAIDFALKNYTFREGAALNIILVTDEGRDAAAVGHYGLGASADYETCFLPFLTAKNAMLNVIVNARFKYDADGEPLETDPKDPVALGVDSKGNAFIANSSGGYDPVYTGMGYVMPGSGAGDTEAAYVELAWATGGAAWDLSLLAPTGGNVASFTEAFVDIKVGEIEFQEPTPDPNPPGPGPVPEPGSIVIWSLLGLTFASASLRRRRRRA